MEPNSMAYGNFTTASAYAYALQQHREEGLSALYYSRRSAELPRHVMEVMEALYSTARVVQADETRMGKMHEPQQEVTITRRLTVLRHE